MTSTKQFNSDLAELEERYRKHLATFKKSDGSHYGKRYVKDKVSRLRYLTSVISPKILKSVSHKNLSDLIDQVIASFAHNPKSGTKNKHLDYVIVVRHLFEMNNKNKPAPRHTHYGGIRRR